MAGKAQRLSEKTALITGGDSGIGRAVTVAFAKEGADIAISYLNEHEDAEEIKKYIEQKGRRCLLITGDIGEEVFCKEVIETVIEEFEKLDILVNNAGEQHEQPSLKELPAEQLERTFRTNIFSMFYLTKAALHYLKPGSAVV